ncbi:glucosamine-6-phosphate deaminase [Spartobacteria bacterium LR76]|nr:glucosamine-6-phosphate deaminase [Spartobacteria bacterium LR76]
MEVAIHASEAEACRDAARQIAALICRKPDAVLGLATGRSPLGVYAELIRMHRNDGLDFSRATTFNLDEYVGLRPSHPSSYNHFMWTNFFDHINVNPARVFLPSGTVEGRDVEGFCQRYEAEIARAGGIDMQILGIGSDGHIGFNEPGSSLASRTRIKTLTARTRQDNAPYFQTIEEVPYHVITMGVGTIMDARSVLLMAFGTSKAKAVGGCVEGAISAALPASILQMHPRAIILLDEDSADCLSRKDYYRWVLDHKPAWQHSSLGRSRSGEDGPSAIPAPERLRKAVDGSGTGNTD